MTRDCTMRACDCPCHESSPDVLCSAPGRESASLALAELDAVHLRHMDIVHESSAGLLATADELNADNARLREALDLLRPAHHTPYADEEHQGSNCVDIAMRYCLYFHKVQVAEAALAKIREWCDQIDTEAARHPRTDLVGIGYAAALDRVARSVRSLLPPADTNP